MGESKQVAGEKRKRTASPEEAEESQSPPPLSEVEEETGTAATEGDVEDGDVRSEDSPSALLSAVEETDGEGEIAEAPPEAGGNETAEDEEVVGSEDTEQGGTAAAGDGAGAGGDGGGQPPQRTRGQGNYGHGPYDHWTDVQDLALLRLYDDNRDWTNAQVALAFNARFPWPQLARPRSGNAVRLRRSEIRTRGDTIATMEAKIAAAGGQSGGKSGGQPGGGKGSGSGTGGGAGSMSSA